LGDRSPPNTQTYLLKNLTESLKPKIFHIVFTATLTQSMHFESTKLRRQKSFCSSLSLQDLITAIFDHKESKN
jgi:hypothetical protein